MTITFYPHYKDHFFAEQEAINRFAYHMPYSQHVKIIPQKGINSYMHELYGRPGKWPGNWERGDWIIHLPAVPIQKRIEILTEIIDSGQIS